jgi:phage terminase small subunit
MQKGVNVDELTKEEIEDILTPKQRIWAHEYIVDWNASRAARAAGYKENSAHDMGLQNKKRPIIARYIELIKDDIAKNVGISKQMLINELKSLAFSSIANLHDTWITRKEFDSLSPEDKAAIQEINTSVKKIKVDGEEQPIDVEYVKIKLHDKRGAIQDILKAMGWNEPDKLKVTGEMTNIINLGEGIKPED